MLFSMNYIESQKRGPTGNGGVGEVKPPNRAARGRLEMGVWGAEPPPRKKIKNV